MELKSRHLPLGILDDSSFSDKVDIIKINDNDKVILSTDGILEAENSSGEMFGVERFTNCLQVNMNNIDSADNDSEIDLFEHILDTLDNFIQGQEQSDDITLGVISCDMDYIKQLVSQRGSYKKIVPTHWEFELLFYYDCIKTIDPVPLINQIMGEIQGHQIQQDKLSTVLTELFCNALDHGLLELDSSIKSSPEGFMQFYTDKEELLNKLDSGSIKISVKNIPNNTGGELFIIFEDSGQDFDVSSLEKTETDKESPLFSGRGLSLIKNYCQSVSFNDAGNRIECIYSWSNS